MLSGPLEFVGSVLDANWREAGEPACAPPTAAEMQELQAMFE